MLYKRNRNQAFKVGEVVKTNKSEYPNSYVVRNYNAGWDEYYLETLEGEMVMGIFYKKDLVKGEESVNLELQ